MTATHTLRSPRLSLFQPIPIPATQTRKTLSDAAAWPWLNSSLTVCKSCRRQAIAYLHQAAVIRQRIDGLRSEFEEQCEISEGTTECPVSDDVHRTPDQRLQERMGTCTSASSILSQ